MESSAKVSVDQIAAIASHVRHEYGETGYRIGIVGGIAYACFEVSHSDGSTFRLLIDPYCNIRRLHPDETMRDARDRLDREVESSLEKLWARVR